MNKAKADYENLIERCLKMLIAFGGPRNPDPSPEHEVLRTERDRALWSAFHKLSQRCQELLRLTVLAGRAEYRAVAEALHMPHGSIGPTRGRCLNNLRSLYDGDSGS